MGLCLEADCEPLDWSKQQWKHVTACQALTSQSNCSSGCLLPPGFTPPSTGCCRFDWGHE